MSHGGGHGDMGDMGDMGGGQGGATTTATTTATAKTTTTPATGGGGHGDMGARVPCSDPNVLVFNYENAWTLPLMLFMGVLFPIAMRYRIQGKLEGDQTKLRRGYVLLFVCWFIVLICTIGTTSYNSIPHGMTGIDVRVVYGIWLIMLPSFIAVRDFLGCCNYSATTRLGVENAHGGSSSSATPTSSSSSMNGNGANGHASSGGSKKTSAVVASSTSPSAAGPVPGSWREFIEFQGKFWDLAFVGLGSLAIPIVASWAALGSHELNTDIGHFVPGLGFSGYAGLLLYFAGPTRAKSMDLVRAEGWMWVTWGGFFDIYFSIWTKERGFWGTWGNGEEHLYQALMYIWAGGLSLLMSRLGIRAGWPMSVLCLSMAAMMSNHGQACMIISMMHKYTGYFFFFAGVFRYLNRILETSFFMMMAAGTFFFSNNASTYWADRYFDQMSYVFFTMVICGTWWGYMAYTFRDLWWDCDEARGVTGRGEYDLLMTQAGPNDV